MQLPQWIEDLTGEARNMAAAVYRAVMAKDGDAERALRAARDTIAACFDSDQGSIFSRDMPLSEQTPVLRFQAARQADASGLVWEAVIIAPGISAGYPRFYWSEEVLESSVAVFENVDINAYELTADFFSHLPIPDLNALENVKRFLAAKKVGWVEKCWFEAGAGIKAQIRFLEAQRWLPDMLAEAQAAGKTDVLGLSIDSRIRGWDVKLDEFSVIWVTQIVSCSSVDVVTYPAAGGKFLRAVAGLYQQPKESVMNWKEKLLAMIGKANPALLEGKDRAAMSDEEIIGLAQMAMEKPVKSPAEGDGQRAAQGMTPEAMRAEMQTAVAALGKEIEQRAACARVLEKNLAASNLPALTQSRLRTRFEGGTFEEAALDEAIKQEKEYLAAMSAPPELDLGDQSRIHVGLNTMAKIQIAIDRSFGLTQADMQGFARMERLDNKPVFQDLRAAQDFADYAQVPAFSGLREMYVHLTGDTEITGRFNRANLPADLRAAQDITSATFAFAIGNTLHRRLIKDYREANFQEDLLISIRKPVPDFKTQEAIKVGYFSDLDNVDPEAADYQEIGAVTDEEATYAILQKGNILTITRKMIINDDKSLVSRLVSRLGRAARRTHAKYVWNLWIANANCSDGTAWHTAPHGNLGAAALSFATVLIAYKALAAMTEKDSGEIIGLLDSPSVKPTLFGPVDLMETLETISLDEYYYSANDLTTKVRNPLKGKINHATVSLLSDANDWGLILPSSEVDHIEMGYLNGRQEPEMFVADAPQAEQVFVADKIRHKIRHEYAGTPVDFVGSYKAIVA
jgi:hypothetical protein